MPTGQANRKPKPLNLDIYSALLGGRPTIEPPPSAETVRPDRLRVSVRVEATIEPGTPRPFLEASLREQFGRCAAQAAFALAEARQRLIDVMSTSTIGRRDRLPQRRSRPQRRVA